MTTPEPQKLSPQILDAASYWFVEFNEGHVEDSARQKFVQWLRVSPEHVRGYLQISSHWEDARALDTPHKATIDELIAVGRREALILPLDREVHSLFPSTATADSRPRADTIAAIPPKAGMHSKKPAYRPWAFAATALLAAASLWFYSQRNLYTTGIGEQRFIKLTDGSTIDLNSRSRIRVSFSGQQREIELIEGQALFKVEKDRKRPFVVQSKQTRVTAIGTQFDVYQKSSGTIVTVVEGKVAITSGGASVPDTDAVPDSPSKILLSAGEQVTVTPVAMDSTLYADVAAVTAWTEKKLIFRASPLTDVVEEFNRYNSRQMKITGRQLEGLRVSGVFSSTDPDSLLRGLEAQGTFTIHETNDAIEIAPK